MISEEVLEVFLPFLKSFLMDSFSFNKLYLLFAKLRFYRFSNFIVLTLNALSIETNIDILASKLDGLFQTAAEE